MNQFPMIDPGELRTPIQLLNPQQKAGPSGINTTYTLLDTTKAKFVWRSGDDRIKSGQDSARLFLQATIRYRPDVTTRTRIKSPNGIYTIQAINNVQEMNVLLVLDLIGVGDVQ